MYSLPAYDVCFALQSAFSAQSGAFLQRNSLIWIELHLNEWRNLMARKYSRGASREVKNEVHRYKRGTAKSGKGGRVKSRKQAIAIALSKARKKGKKAPKKKAS
jgi:Family of unknown function (DUF6496)